MNDPQKIPTDEMELPVGSSGSPVDSSTPLLYNPSGETSVTLVVKLGGTPTYPEDTVEMDRIEFLSDEIQNVASIQVSYKRDQSSPWEILEPSTVSFTHSYHRISPNYCQIYRTDNHIKHGFLFL